MSDGGTPESVESRSAVGDFLYQVATDLTAGALISGATIAAKAIVNHTKNDKSDS